MAIFLPSYGAQLDSNNGDSVVQASPLLHNYSPRLFGSPPQLTSLCDMRMDSSDGNRPGPVGDFYLNNILRDAQVANFVVGRALFTGGYNSVANGIRMIAQYNYALRHYNIYNADGVRAGNSVEADFTKEINLDTYKNALSLDDISLDDVRNGRNAPQRTTATDENAGVGANGTGGGGHSRTSTDTSGTSGEGNMRDATTSTSTRTSTSTDTIHSNAELEYAEAVANTAKITQWAENMGSLLISGMVTPLLDSLSIEQPFYSFDADWYTYINNVKMMINTAVIMLGLQSACVRIGDYYYPIGMDHDENRHADVWSNYRFITADDGVSIVTGIDNQRGDTSQYVSFMVTPVTEGESYTNTVGDSQIYSSVINQGITIGNEIAFITNSSQSTVTDAVINIANGSISAAEQVVSALGGGVGRFTAAIAGSMARSFTGDHTIYPKVFQSHESHGGMTLNTKLRASRGDAYSYLTEILVPLFFIMGMVLPKMSKNSSAAYNFPPLVQCTIPGVWSTRLGIIESVEITKNPDGNDFSVNGYPLAVDVNIRVTDLTHCLVTSPMNQPALFLNNHTMFDYIAACCGVDKYRINGSIRLVSKLALTASSINNALYNVGSAILNDAKTRINRLTRTSMM